MKNFVIKLCATLFVVTGIGFLSGCSITLNHQSEIVSSTVDESSLESPESSIHSEHVLVIDKGIEPTCTTHGLTEGSHCSVCGEILVPQEIIEPLGHDYHLIDPVESTCSQEGSSTGLVCARCESILIEPKCVDKKPHTRGNFVKLTVDEIENVYNPAVYECSVCHEEYYDTLNKEDVDIPILSIDGDLSGISKDNKKQVVASYVDDEQSFELCATLKLQGATSINFPKKNYNIQFFKDNHIILQELS